MDLDVKLHLVSIVALDNTVFIDVSHPFSEPTVFRQNIAWSLGTFGTLRLPFGSWRQLAASQRLKRMQRSPLWDKLRLPEPRMFGHFGATLGPWSSPN